MRQFQTSFTAAAIFLASLSPSSAASDADSDLLAACMADRGIDKPEDVKAALAMGADINVRDEQSGQTCLMAATLRGKINIVKYLFGEGADSSIGENSGYTPPHGAAFQGRPDVMRFLSESGMDVHEFHQDGYAPLHRTCWGREDRHFETFKTLIDLGGDPELLSKDGKTCRDMTSNPAIMEYLGVEAEL